jgi:hypothetical protein
MSIEFVFVWTLFMHVLDDYGLQGVWHSMKQKTWVGNEDELKHPPVLGAIPALLCHALSWSFMTMLPLAYYYHFNVNIFFVLFFFANTCWHAIIQNNKPYAKGVSFVTEQAFHIVQILVTLAFYKIFA